MSTTNKERVALAKAIYAQAKADQAYNMAIGMVYVVNNYQEMVTALNTAAPSIYALGATIYVKTTNVPDLWFASVNEATSVTYTYVSDAQFESDLKSNPNGLQIGKYKVCMQEGPKLNFVAFDTAQTLTAQQKAQAKANIGAISDGTVAGQAPVWDGSQYKKQSGYGYEEGEQTTITWDGDTTGKEYVEIEGDPYLFKISNPTVLPTKQDLLGGTATFNNDITLTDDKLQYLGDNNELLFGIDLDLPLFMIAYSNCTFEEMVFTKGIWLFKSDQWVSKLQWGNLTVHQFDEKFIPDKVTGTNDGTNWLTLKINNVTKNIPQQPQIPATLPATVVTTAPTADNPNGIIIADLDTEPATKYNGYLYLLPEEE